MACRMRIVPMIAVAMFLLGAVAAIPGAGNAAERNEGNGADRNTVVIGIVGYARGDVVTVAGKTYDLGGARFQDGRGAPLAHPSDLRGTSIEILSRNGRIETVTLYRTLPQ